MQTTPGNIGRYASLWLNMSAPWEVKSGYQLRWKAVDWEFMKYEATLSKWSSGTETVLASNSSIVIPEGTTFAIPTPGGRSRHGREPGGHCPRSVR